MELEPKKLGLSLSQPTSEMLGKSLTSLNLDFLTFKMGMPTPQSCYSAHKK